MGIVQLILELRTDNKELRFESCFGPPDHNTIESP